MPPLSDALADLSAAMPALPSLLYHLLLAFVLATPIAWIYSRTHQGTSYSRSFVQSLILLPLIVTIVMMAIGDSLARAFGLFGALALIRFRTPIKDSRDTIFLFLSVAVGITVGVQNTALAIAGTGFVLLAAAYLAAIGFGKRVDHDSVLQFSMPAQGEQDAQLRQVLQHYCRRFALVSLRESRRDGAMDFAYQLHLRDPGCQQALVADLCTIPGAQDVNLFLQDDHTET